MPHLAISLVEAGLRIVNHESNRDVPGGEDGLVASGLRVLSIVEGTSVTGPIKPLLMFADMVRDGGRDFPPIELALATTVRSRGTEYPDNLLLAAVRGLGIRIEVLRERRAWDLRVMAQLCRVIQARRPHIIETHQVKCHFILALALALGRTSRTFSWIAYHHGYTRASLKLSFYEMLDRWSLKRPDRIVTVCRPFAADLIRRGAPADRVSVISNAVVRRPRPAETELSELRRQWHLPEQEFVIASVGRLSPEKGHIDLLEAFRRMLAELPQAAGLRLLIIGDGPDRSMLERAAADLGDRVTFLGHQANVWPFYFLADVFALPSHTEGSPLVLLEAMAAELPIVATSVGGVPETVEDTVSALLVPAGDVSRMKQALARLHADGVLGQRLAANASRRLKEFSPEAYRDRLLGIYESALPRGLRGDLR